MKRKGEGLIPNVSAVTPLEGSIDGTPERRQKSGRRARGVGSAAIGQSSEVTSVVPPPALWEAALRAVDGDASRLEVAVDEKSEVFVRVHNNSHWRTKKKPKK